MLTMHQKCCSSVSQVLYLSLSISRAIRRSGSNQSVVQMEKNLFLRAIQWFKRCLSYYFDSRIKVELPVAWLGYLHLDDDLHSSQRSVTSFVTFISRAPSSRGHGDSSSSVHGWLPVHLPLSLFSLSLSLSLSGGFHNDGEKVRERERERIEGDRHHSCVYNNTEHKWSGWSPANSRNCSCWIFHQLFQ